MKKGILVIFIIMMFNQMFAQEIFDNYIQISSLTNIPVVNLNQKNDLIKIAKENNIKNAYIQISNNHSIIFIDVHGLFYSFPINGYMSLIDYELGSLQNFENSEDYYKAKVVNINDGDLYKYYSRNSFINLGDCINAYNNGFIFNNSNNSKSIIVPEMMQKEYHDLLCTIFPLYYSHYNEVYKKSSTFPLVLLDKSKDIITNRQLENGKYYEVKESQIYYLATSFNFKTYKEYLSFYDSRIRGFLSVEDYNKAYTNGFGDALTYYSAINNGFTNLTDYLNAKQLSISTNIEYQKFMDTNLKILKIQNDITKNRNEALVYYYLSLLPPKKTLSVQAINKYINTELAVVEKLKMSYRSELNDTILNDFFSKSYFQQLGEFNIESGVFIKK